MSMSLFSLIFGSKPKTAAIAKERLQLIIAHERNGSTSTPDFLPAFPKTSRCRLRSRATSKYWRSISSCRKRAAGSDATIILWLLLLSWVGMLNAGLCA